MLTLNTIAPARGSRSKSFRVGRGNASGRGTTAGKGTKGQRARSGGRNGLKLKGLRQMLLSFPKLRGFQSRFVKPATLPLKRVYAAFKTGEQVDLSALKAKNLVTKTAEAAKLVGAGPVDKALMFVNIYATTGAKAAVEKAGGSFKIEKAKAQAKEVKGANKSKAKGKKA